MNRIKTTLSHLIRYKPSGSYFGRVRVNGKLIRRSLETHVLTVAKLKLSDFLQDHRRLAVNKGQSVNGEVIIEMFYVNNFFQSCIYRSENFLTARASHIIYDARRVRFV